MESGGVSDCSGSSPRRLSSSFQHPSSVRQRNGDRIRAQRSGVCDPIRGVISGYVSYIITTPNRAGDVGGKRLTAPVTMP